MTDHAATYLAIGLTLAVVVGVYWEKLAQSYRDVYSLRARLRSAKGIMRSARLLFAVIAAIVIFIVWPYLHGFR